MIKPGLVSITFRDLTPPQIIDLVVRAELDGIEWGGDVHVPHGEMAQAEAVGAMTREAGLEVAAYGSYYRAGVSEAEGLSFESVLKSAKALGAPLIRVWPGNKASATVDGSARQGIVEDLKRIGAMAAVEQIGVSLEYHANTLTDTDGSAQQLLQELAGSNVKLYWQPPNGKPFEQNLRGLKAVLPEVTNLHVFHWETKEGKNIRLPLADGEERWPAYLSAASTADRYGLIEFVAKGTAEQFLEDAATLKGWLA